MSRLNQIIQNTFIRIVAFLEQFFKGFLGFLAQLIGGVARLLGFSNSGDFLDFEEAQGTQRREIQQSADSQQEIEKPVATNPSSRRSNSNMDYYRNLARQIKTSD